MTIFHTPIPPPPKKNNWYILANCPYFYPRKKSEFIMCPYFCKNLPVVMYRIFRNVPIFKDIPPICPYFLGFRVGKYASINDM